MAPDAYLRQARAVCRRQFTARILGIKIAAVQQVGASCKQWAADGWIVHGFHMCAFLRRRGSVALRQHLQGDTC